ncbi:hypothetical protein AB0L33_05520 [Streptomyces sp. NPDC052299]|uniref:hypothetical protein n=1 Tax=Streptomyces sp. NPDC052299 TaxID=3155054 RepID=UPI00342DF8AC
MSKPRHFAAFVVCAAVLTATTNSATAADPKPFARFHGQHVDWHACALDADDETGQALDAAAPTVPTSPCRLTTPTPTVAPSPSPYPV